MTLLSFVLFLNIIVFARVNVKFKIKNSPTKCIFKKNEKKMIFFEKAIDKSKTVWYNIEAVREGRDKIARRVCDRKNLKKVEKTFKKGIDKANEMWYNIKAVAKRRQRSLKIEQQERSTKL